MGFWGRSLLLVSIAGSLAACKNGSGTGSEGCPTCGAYGDVLDGICDFIDRCPSAIASYPIAYRSRAECVQILAFLTTCRLQEIGDSRDFTVVENIPKIDPTKAEACATWLKTLTCDALSTSSNDSTLVGRMGTPCDAIASSFVSGSVSSSQPGLGQDCSKSSCADGLYCTNPTYLPDRQALTCAVCNMLPASGQDCTMSGYRCADGFYCQTSRTGTAACAAVGSTGAMCASSDQCASTFCNPNTKSCDAGGNAGDPCTMSTDCRPEMFCGSGHCSKLLKNGSTCTGDGQCANTTCTMGVCGLANGSACSNNSNACASSYCDSTSQQCAAGKADGQACASANECASGWCSFTSHVCQEHCNSDMDCMAGQFCSFQQETCLAKLANGTACEDPTNCMSGFCNANQQCETKPGIGDACGNSVDCYPLGYCTGGKCQRRHAPGQSCDAIDGCTDPFLCMSGTCQPMFLECRGAPAGSFCTYLRVCDASSYCELGSFICKARANKGDKCNNVPCGPNLFCDPTATTCVDALAAGAACKTSDQCASGTFCVAGANGAMTCSAGPEGTPCSSQMPCPTGLFCSEMDNTCHAPGSNGAQCNDSSQCIATNYCVVGGGSGTGCQPKPSLGGACWTDVPCADGFYCDLDSRSCKADATQGQACNDNPPFGVQCVAGSFCNFDLVTRMQTCKAQYTTGSTCSQDLECVSGACHSNSNGMSTCLSTSMCVMK
jgi:hypothetical protein